MPRPARCHRHCAHGGTGACRHEGVPGLGKGQLRRTRPNGSNRHEYPHPASAPFAANGRIYRRG